MLEKRQYRAARAEAAEYADSADPLDQRVTAARMATASTWMSPPAGPVTVKGFIRQIQISCSQSPNPSHSAKLLGRQGWAQEPGCTQIPTPSASCCPSSTDRFYWAVEG